jgi:hypothetical protein
MPESPASPGVSSTDPLYRNLQDFLFHSISEIQNVIRAVDAKLGFLFTLILVPLSQFEKILKFCKVHLLACPGNDTRFFSAIFAVLACCWVLSLLLCILGIQAINNPSKRIRKKDGTAYLDCYFLGGQFYHKKGFYHGGAAHNNLLQKTGDIFAVSNFAESRRYLEEYAKIITDEQCDIIKVLVSEQLKIAYIRDIKILRQTWALKLTGLWLFGGIALYTIIKLRS